MFNITQVKSGLLSRYAPVCSATRAAEETEAAGNMQASHQGWTFKESKD